jgi:NADH dehydrogenase FAD-containing subunit
LNITASHVYTLSSVQLFCTGQKPNTDFLQAYGDVVDAKTGMARVTNYLQLSPRDATNQQDFNHIFVAGDAADAFGALNAGHNASGQAEVAARNISRLIALEEQIQSSQPWINTPLEAYEAEPHKIKVSVGFERYLNENNGKHKFLDNGSEDLNAANMWRKRGLDPSDMFV